MYIVTYLLKKVYYSYFVFYTVYNSTWINFTSDYFCTFFPITAYNVFDAQNHLVRAKFKLIGFRKKKKLVYVARAFDEKTNQFPGHSKKENLLSVYKRSCATCCHGIYYQKKKPKKKRLISVNFATAPCKWSVFSTKDSWRKKKKEINVSVWASKNTLKQVYSARTNDILEYLFRHSSITWTPNCVESVLLLLF